MPPLAIVAIVAAVPFLQRDWLLAGFVVSMVGEFIQLWSFASLDKNSEFIAYTSVRGAEEYVPSRIRTRQVSENPFVRLGIDLARRVRADAPDLLHVQYTAPLFCPAPVVVSIHDVSYIEHPEFFTTARRVQLQISVERTVRRAAKILTLSEFSRQGIARSYGLDPGRIATEMTRALDDFKKELAAGGEGLGDFDVGIGLHTGPAVVGFLGSDSRMEYTAIGDTVNLASRIEGLTKGRAHLLVSAATREACTLDLDFVAMGEHQVKGRAEAVMLYEPQRRNDE